VVGSKGQISKLVKMSLEICLFNGNIVSSKLAFLTDVYGKDFIIQAGMS
jgi:hypothetical protein